MIHSNLLLESGEIFPGSSPQWQNGLFSGEVVFTTGMIGYVESLTDPSYAGQILVFTYPLIGNYGVPHKKYWESARVQVNGVVFGTISRCFSHHSAETSLLDWLSANNIPFITGVDTRELTKRLRKKGTILGAIASGKAALVHQCAHNQKTIKPLQSHLEQSLTWHLVDKVSCKRKTTVGSGEKKIIAVDCGMKESIMRHLQEFPLTITRVPYDFDYTDEEYDGLFISNGPADPAVCIKTIAILQKALRKKKPIFGICLGAQLLALAAGGKTYKLTFGHRGQNHPCLDIARDKAILTAQNHGYAIDAHSLPESWRVTFTNLNDNSVEGIAHNILPFFAVQFHPESNPGPTDARYLFEQFYTEITSKVGV